MVGRSLPGGAQFAVDITLVCIACTLSPSSRAQVVVLAVGVRDALFKPIAFDETPHIMVEKKCG